MTLVRPSIAPVILVLSASLAGAQEGGVAGRVMDAVTETPVAGAEVLIVTPRTADTSDAEGRFGPIPLPGGSYAVEIRRVGYEGAMWELELPPGILLVYDFALTPIATPLPPEVIRGDSTERRPGLRGFEERRAKGSGQFVTRADIERRDAASLGDLLRTLNGLRIDCTRRGCAIRMTRWALNCIPEYFVDGFPTNPGTAELMPVRDLHGVEVYTVSEVPVEFQRRDMRCGVIALWTQRGPARR